MTISRLLIHAAIACGLCLPLGLPSAAQEDVSDDAVNGGENCIDTRRISTTTVVDDQTIIFYMRGGENYVNELPRKCPSLARERRFSYRTSISRLCDIDTITVLYSMGRGLEPGPSCGLGRFYPISDEEAKALRAGPDDDIEPQPVPPAEPEEPELGADEDETED